MTRGFIHAGRSGAIEVHLTIATYIGVRRLSDIVLSREYVYNCRHAIMVQWTRDDDMVWKFFGHGPLTRYAKLRVAQAPGMFFPGTQGTFSPPSRVSDPDMHHGTCVTYVPWYMPGSLTSDFLWSRWRGKRSQHSRHMRNTQFCVSGKRPIAGLLWHKTAVTGGSPYSLQTTV